MFDEVRFGCPGCGEVIKVQSKAGDCFLNSYSSVSVPLAIAADLSKEELTCQKCGRKWEVLCVAPESAPLILVPSVDEALSAKDGGL